MMQPDVGVAGIDMRDALLEDVRRIGQKEERRFVSATREERGTSETSPIEHH
jgi:hypothetical protein